MKLRLLALLGLASLISLGCVERDRTNPFDPENPDTKGIPRVLDARAANGEVDLRWDLQGIRDVAAVWLYRRVGDNPATLLTPRPLDPSSLGYLDRAVANETTYAYRADFEIESGGMRPSAEDLATPGDAIVWVADTDGGGLSRMSPDGRDLLDREEEGLWFLDIAADSSAGSFWSVDYLEGSLFEHAPDGTRRNRFRVVGARAVEVDPDGRSIWVASFSRGILERLNRDGSVAWADSTAERVEDILAIGSGRVWTVSSAGEARLYQTDRLLARITDFVRPVAIALTEDARIVILDVGSGRLRRFDFAGFQMGRTDSVLVAATDLASDGAGGVWVADAGRGGIVRFDSRLVESRFVAAPGVRGVTWDGRSGRLWLAGEMGVEQRDREGGFISGRSLGPRPFQVALLHDAEGD